MHARQPAVSTCKHPVALCDAPAGRLAARADVDQGACSSCCACCCCACARPRVWGSKASTCRDTHSLTRCVPHLCPMLLHHQLHYFAKAFNPTKNTIIDTIRIGARRASCDACLSVVPVLRIAPQPPPPPRLPSHPSPLPLLLLSAAAAAAAHGAVLVPPSSSPSLAPLPPHTTTAPPPPPVLIDMRWFLAFLTLTMVGFGLAFYSLFRCQPEPQPKPEPAA